MTDWKDGKNEHTIALGEELERELAEIEKYQAEGKDRYWGQNEYHGRDVGALILELIKNGSITINRALNFRNFTEMF